MSDLDKILWENTKRREWWRIWLSDWESHVRHSDDYRNHLTGLDDLEPDPEPEVLLMLNYLRTCLSEDC